MAYHGADEVAVHESAHACAAFALGLVIEHVTIIPADGFAGSCSVGAGHAATAAVAGQPLSAAESRRHVVVALAARAALGNQYPGPGRYAVDMDRAWSHARAAVGDDPAKAHHVADLVTACWAQAQALTAGLWVAIGDVAKTLEFLKTLEGEHAEREVRAAVEAQLASTWDAAREPAREVLAKYGRRRRQA